MNTLLGSTIYTIARKGYPNKSMQLTCPNIYLVRNTLYYSLVHPYLLYGIILWGSALKRLIGKLEIAQKKAMRAMPGARYNDSSSPLFKRLNILKLKDPFEQQVKLFIYDFVNNVLPEPLLGIYEYHGDYIHGHETRHSTDPKPPNVITELMRRSFLYTGPCICLALDMHIKSSNSRNVFKFCSEMIGHLQSRFIFTFTCTMECASKMITSLSVTKQPLTDCATQTPLLHI